MYTRYEKYVHVTVMYLLEKDLNIVSERNWPAHLAILKSKSI